MSDQNGELESINIEEVQDVEFFKESWLIEENKDIVNLVQSCAADFSMEISQYLGKKIDIEYLSITYFENQTVFKDYKGFIFSIFEVINRKEQGLILFDYQSMSLFINYLYGFIDKDNMESISFGNCALKIADQITNLCISSLEKFFSQRIDFNTQLLKTTLYLKNINFQDIAEKNYEITFQININKTSSFFKLILPTKILEEIAFYSESSKINFSDNFSQAEYNSSLKRDVIESIVNVKAFLPEIRLPLNKVISLKPGDLIEINNPALVELCVDNKIVSMAQVGQLNSYKVIKTLESIKKE